MSPERVRLIFSQASEGHAETLTIAFARKSRVQSLGTNVCIRWASLVQTVCRPSSMTNAHRNSSIFDVSGSQASQKNIVDLLKLRKTGV